MSYMLRSVSQSRVKLTNKTKEMVLMSMAIVLKSTEVDNVNELDNNNNKKTS